MPVYEYTCEDGHLTTAFKKLAERNTPVPCDSCEQEAERAFVTSPHMGAIPGIHNKVNRNWKETGQVLYDPNRPEHMPKYKNPK